jgi:flavin-dependent dehydrogenase
MSVQPPSELATSGGVWDAVVLGGGPAGAASAIGLARRGHRVLVVEKDHFPRFHVGESLIPQDMQALAELGVLDDLAKLPQAKKTGVEFALGDGSAASRIDFDEALGDGPTQTFNLERALFDDVLLSAARRAGAEVWPGQKVTSIDRLEDGDVRLTLADGAPVRARLLLDATGQATVVGRHTKTRRNFDAPRYRKVAYFGHFENVRRDNALGDDCITMVMCDEAWFWMIPIDERRVSIGMVLDAAVAKRAKCPAHAMLAWGIERCPLVRDRVAGAVWPEKNQVVSDYSYTCAPYAGPGYFLVGDAATFLDPVFSTGIYLGLEGARGAAGQASDVLAGRTSPQAARRRYQRTLRRGTRPFFRLIHAYYEPAFRDLFLNGTGPLSMHRAAIAVLSGRAFPRPIWAVRWRMRLLYLCARLQRRWALVPRRAGFSLQQHELTAPTVSPAPRPTVGSNPVAAPV